jgi:peptidyl-prolyl cis-trans isomerase A (cyclophilin A)
MRAVLPIALTVLLSAGATACMPSFGCKAESPNPNTAPDSFVVTMETSRGRVEVMVHKDWAPIGVNRFYELTKGQFFDDIRFFRVIKGFMAQFGLSGDSKVNGAWRSRCLADEPVKHSNTRGTISFARAGKNTRSTQLFINLADNIVLDTDDGGYPPIGEVVAGMDAVDSLYAEYGDSAPRSGAQYGREGPNQDSIVKLGNAYLSRGWPKLDYIKTARVTRQWPTR